jgi:glycosyltransferase involved in cell wall biosynthesis
MQKAVDNPLISIVTVVFNAEKYLEDTIKSVINQTYENIEYIIIDGGSTDGTIDIIKKYKDKIDYWISEKDNGIYDAMNKGFDRASGEWINFMNAGDKFYENKTCNSVFKDNKDFDNVDVIYGDLIVDYGKFQRFEKARSIGSMWKGMVFSHQSSFIRSEYHKEYKYSLNYNIAGDFEFFYNTFKKNKKFKYINNIISIMDVNGLSDGNRFKSIRQMHQIVNDNGFSLKYNVYYPYLYIDQFMRKAVKLCLPESIINLIKVKGLH